MRVVFHYDNSHSTTTHRELGIVSDIEERIKEAFKSLPIEVEFVEGEKHPFFSESLIVFLHNQVPHQLSVGVFITSSYTDDVLMRMALEGCLQRQLNNETFILIATLIGVESEIQHWLNYLSQRHPCHGQIDILWNDGSLVNATLARKLLPWFKGRLRMH